MSSDQLLRALDELAEAPTFDPVKAKALALPLEELLPRFKLPRTPAGTKEMKKHLESMLWVLRHGSDGHFSFLQSDWSFLRPRFQQLLAAFGAGEAPAEITHEGVLYRDGVGMAAGKLAALVKRFDSLWGLVTGWRRAALRPGMTVLFAGPKEFRGTASGKYRKEGDLMLVRATPKIFARPSREYAGLDYILLHELGHRYERFMPLPLDFDRPEWHTTKYSTTDSPAGSEAFAELFALGILEIRGTWGDVLDRFEAVMAGRAMVGRLARR